MEHRLYEFQKPTVNAIQVTGDNTEDVLAFVRATRYVVENSDITEKQSVSLFLEGRGFIKVKPFEWIVLADLAGPAWGFFILTDHRFRTMFKVD